MSLRRAAKRDAVEAEIIDAWLAVGGSVMYFNAKGYPDLLLWHVKTGFVLAENKSRRGKLTRDQVSWREGWRGPQPVILRSVQDALDLFEDVQALARRWR
jgi:hypothetical protein